MASRKINRRSRRGPGAHPALAGTRAPGERSHRPGLLTDAVLYRHPAWATPFDPRQPVRGRSPPPRGATSRPQFFMLAASTRTVTAEHGLDRVWLPYRGGKLGMEALLPPPCSPAARCPEPRRWVANDLPAGTRSALRPDQERLLPTVNIATHIMHEAVLTKARWRRVHPAAIFHTGLPRQGRAARPWWSTRPTLDVGGRRAPLPRRDVPSAGRERRAVMPPLVTFARPYLLVVTEPRER